MQHPNFGLVIYQYLKQATELFNCIIMIIKDGGLWKSYEQ